MKAFGFFSLISCTASESSKKFTSTSGSSLNNIESMVINFFASFNNLFFSFSSIISWSDCLFSPVFVLFCELLFSLLFSVDSEPSSSAPSPKSFPNWDSTFDWSSSTFNNANDGLVKIMNKAKIAIIIFIKLFLCFFIIPPLLLFHKWYYW